MDQSSSTTTHSALVHITLHVNGLTIRVAQMGPDFLILKDAIQLPPSDGKVTLVVDGNVQTFDVHFPNGISAESKRVTVANVAIADCAIA